MERKKILKITKPILFNTEMVRAILDGRKTVTRRCVKPQPPTYAHIIKRASDMFMWQVDMHDKDIKPPYRQGDILYVRETWSDHYVPDEDGKAKLEYCYKADGIDIKSECLPGENNRWYPSIHMPKEAARIFLKVKDVRVERLHGMDWRDALDEGVNTQFPRTETGEYIFDENPIDDFIDLWNSTIKKSDLATYGWDANPWVWVIEFERLD